MKAALIRANHGNHTGFNREWSLITLGTKKQCKNALKDYREEIEDNHRFEIISQSDVYSDFFSGGFNGYFPNCLKDIFETN